MQPVAVVGRDARIQHMILKKGILFEQGSIDWTREMLQVMADESVPV